MAWGMPILRTTLNVFARCSRGLRLFQGLCLFHSLEYIKFVIFQDQTTALEDKRRQLNQAFEKEVIHIMALDTAVAECMWGPINMVIS